MTKNEAQIISNEWKPFSLEKLKERLRGLADPGYQAFHSKLIPGTENVLGVRTPKLRALAREIQKGDWEAFLGENDRTWYENDILQALVTAGAKMEPQERLSRIRDFLPRIENWAVCDIFCGSLKDADRYPELYWDFLQPYFRSRQPYELRFAVVMLLSHFVKKKYLGLKKQVKMFMLCLTEMLQRFPSEATACFSSPILWVNAARILTRMRAEDLSDFPHCIQKRICCVL